MTQLQVPLPVGAATGTADGADTGTAAGAATGAADDAAMGAADGVADGTVVDSAAKSANLAKAYEQWRIHMHFALICFVNTAQRGSSNKLVCSLFVCSLFVYPL